MAGAGTQTSALSFSGGGNTANTELYNGTNWTEVNNLNTGRSNSSGAGADNTSAICVGGETPSVTANAELGNGTNWTEVNNLNTARDRLTTIGIATSALSAGGEPGNTVTELFNGTNWTEQNDLSTTRAFASGAGTATAGLVFGGGPAVTATEEWNGAGAGVTRTFTDS